MRRTIVRYNSAKPDPKPTVEVQEENATSCAVNEQFTCDFFQALLAPSGGCGLAREADQHFVTTETTRNIQYTEW